MNQKTLAIAIFLAAGMGLGACVAYLCGMHDYIDLFTASFGAICMAVGNAAVRYMDQRNKPASGDEP